MGQHELFFFHIDIQREVCIQHFWFALLMVILVELVLLDIVGFRRCGLSIYLS